MKNIIVLLFIILNLFFMLDKVNARCDNSLQLEINAASSVVTIVIIAFVKKYNRLKNFGGAKI